MLMIISPAKKLDFKSAPVSKTYTIPEFLEDSEVFIKKLKTFSPAKVSKLMGISKTLGELNFERYQTWHLPFTPENAKQAVLAFNGDVYQGLVAKTLSEKQLEFAQEHLRILSGLYGVLRPLDLIQPYRLEMGAKLPVKRKKNLYQYWSGKITQNINKAVQVSGSDILVNLASNEYYKSIDTNKIEAKIITPKFKDLKNREYKIISLFAKKARGLMARFIIENRITNPEDIKAFESDGYYYNPRLSESTTPVFTREK